MSCTKSIEMKNVDDIVHDSEIMTISENRRTFEYNLDDKAAKAKLLKGAKRDHFEVVSNQTSCNLVFSVGSWNHVVLPSVQYLSQIKGSKTCTIGTTEVKVVSVKTGKDIVGKHIDTQIVFFANRDKVVCHFYNTTQLILVNGHGYAKLVEVFLKPFFESKIPLYEEDIETYNKLVIETLGAKKVKRSNVKYKGGSTFPCIKCDFAGKTMTALEKHKKKDHAVSFVASTTASLSASLALPRHSTRNNSIIEAMIEDNITITDLSASTNENDVGIGNDNEVLKYTCLECNFATKDKGCMDAHVKNVHTDSRTGVDFICRVCKHEFDKEDNYNAHVKTHEIKIQEVPTESLLDSSSGSEKEIVTLDVNVSPSIMSEQFQCAKCEFAFPGILELNTHIEMTHQPKMKHSGVQDDTSFVETLTCRICDFDGSASGDLKKHMLDTHKNVNHSDVEANENTLAKLFNIPVKKSYLCEEDKCNYEAANSRDLITHFLNIHNFPSINLKCDLCDFVAYDDKLLNVHKVNNHKDSTNFTPVELIKVFYNAIGSMLMETNERMEKINSDTNKSLIYLMDNQSKLVDSVDYIKNEFSGVKSKIGEIKKATKKKKKKEVITEQKEVPGAPTVSSEVPVDIGTEEIVDEVKEENRKQKISWIGTSISKALNKDKLEKDIDAEVKITRAYCIKEEENARYKKTNFRAVVPAVVENEKPDILVLQTGSIEITNINVNAALMDATKDIKEYKKEWFKMVEQDSKNLLEIAQDALKKNKKLKKVIIFKRLPRYDRSTADLIGIKAELSNFANTVYDLEWTKIGSPENIHILDLDLEGSGYFRDVVFGHYRSQKFDGIHLVGKSANLHFTYRVVKALKMKVFKLSDKLSDNYDHTNCPQSNYIKSQANKFPAYRRRGQSAADRNTGSTFPSHHFQAQHKQGYRSYSDVLKQGPSYTSYQGENIYNHLNY